MSPSASRRIAPLTAGTRTSARSSSTFLAGPPPAGSMRSSTAVPAGPLIRAVETSEGIPAIDLPSTATIRSPCSSPAFSAGVSGSTLATRRPCGASVTVSPTPEKRPDVAEMKSAYWSDVK